MVELTRRGQRMLGAVIVLLLFGGMTLVYLRQGPAVVTADVALEEFRASPDAGGAAATPVTEPAPGADAVAPVMPVTPGGASGPAQPGAPASPPAGGGADPAPPPSPAASAVGKPAPGVYEYRTTGYEQTDALGGSRHEYPASSYTTIRDNPACGITVRWQPLRERWDESTLCPEGDNIALRHFTMYHEFFQQGLAQSYACAAGSHVYRHGAAPDTTWTWHCEGEAGTIDTVVRVVGTEPMTIGGRTVDVQHLRYDSRIAGDSRGTQTQERWFDAATGLMTRITTKVDVQTKTPVGEAHYIEDYRIDLVSMQPRT